MILMRRQEPTFIYFFHKVLQQMGCTEVVDGGCHICFSLTIHAKLLIKGEIIWFNASRLVKRRHLYVDTNCDTR